MMLDCYLYGDLPLLVTEVHLLQALPVQAHCFVYRLIWEHLQYLKV